MNVPETSQEKRDIYLIDGSGFIFRAYHALPPLTREDGTPVGAVVGFVNMLIRLLQDSKAESIIMVFDAARENFRNGIFPAYKQNRDETPEDLIPQFPLIRRAAQAFGLPIAEKEGFEADDLIATYAQKAHDAGHKVTIVSSDKDLMQLVGEDVRMYDPIKSRFIGPAEVVEKFGVLPEKVVDVQALAGDSVDNVPGVPGIGIKTAAQLIEEYGDLDTLLERAGEIKQPKRRESLLEHAENARISRELVRLRADVPVGDGFDGRFPDAPPRISDETLAFLREQGFRTALARLERQVEGKTSEVPPKAPETYNTYTLIQDPETLLLWMERAREAGVLAIDTETTHLTPAWAELVGISLSVKPGEGAYIPLGHKTGEGLFSDQSDAPAQMDIATVREILGPVLEDPTILKIGHNVKYDLQMLTKAGMKEVSPVDDTMLMSYVLDGTGQGHGLDDLAEKLCGHTTIKYDDVTGTGKNRISFDYVPLDKASDYAAEDADITLRLHGILKPRLAQERVCRVYEDIERPLVSIIAKMEETGICVDAGILKSLSGTFGHTLAALEAEIHVLAGHRFNVGSPKQLGTVLFDEMGFQGGKKTKTGDWQTGADLLESLQDDGNGIVGKVLEWRQLSKLISTYTDTLPRQINARTGRVHTSFSMAGTNTGRLSSSEPNLQNIPIRTEEGRKIRTAFVAPPGWSLLSVDYSQIELRLAAEIAGIAFLKDAFRNHLDIHAMTASQVFGQPLEQVTPEQRRQAKAINFGILYGSGPYGLARQIGCTPGDAKLFMEAYMQRFPELQAYMDKKKEEAREHGCVRTLYGRKCLTPGILDKNPARKAFAERQAINAPLQGTAADIIKRAMIEVSQALESSTFRARLLLQVHDELILECPEEEVQETSALVRSVMENAARLEVPLVAEAGIGKNWAEAH